MNVERAALTRALTTGAVSTLLSRGVERTHFSLTPDGEECAAVFDWAVEHTRKYNVSPSQQLLKERWPNWRAEPSSDPLEALIDSFHANVKRRAYAAKVIELSTMDQDPGNWHRLDEIMLDAARDLAAIAPGSKAMRLSEMNQLIDQYEKEAAEGVLPGFQLGIPKFDEQIGGVRPGEVIVVQGLVNLGKSILTSWMTLNAVEQDNSALFLTLEMPRRQVMERINAMIMNFSHKLLRRRELRVEDVATWRRIAKQYSHTEHDLVVLDGLSGCTIDRVFAEISRYKPKLTVIDYVQLMRRSRVQMQSWEGLVEITNELKAIALSTESTIIMVSQDSRAAADGGSTLTSGAGSISIVQAADVMIGMQQDEHMRAEGRMNVRLLKARDSQRDVEAGLNWEPAFMRFSPVEEGNRAQGFVKDTA